MSELDKKPTFLENVDMMINDAIEHINIDQDISKILRTCRSVIQLKFPLKIKGKSAKLISFSVKKVVDDFSRFFGKIRKHKAFLR